MPTTYLVTLHFARLTRFLVYAADGETAIRYARNYVEDFGSKFDATAEPFSVAVERDSIGDIHQIGGN